MATVMAVLPTKHSCNTEALTMSLDLVRQLTVTDNALTQLVDAATSRYFV